MKCCEMAPTCMAHNVMLDTYSRFVDTHLNYCIIYCKINSVSFDFKDIPNAGKSKLILTV